MGNGVLYKMYQLDLFIFKEEKRNNEKKKKRFFFKFTFCKVYKKRISERKNVKK